jgi:hypothetical protein
MNMSSGRACLRKIWKMAEGDQKVSFKTHPTRDVIKASAFNVLRRRGVQEKDLEAEYQRLLNSRTSISPIKVRARQWPG